jgi:hypothetical protein
MAKELHSEISEINHRLDELDDPRECYALVRECIRRREVAGESVPEELARIEQHYRVECLVQSQGR